MPLNLMEFETTREMYFKGEREGESHMLGLMLERRFGPLPEWVSGKLSSAGNATLEAWGIRLLDAGTLEEVFQ
jgi:hypothetical protein